jgi:glycosyltransferase involved in cell wall biosynthesis
VQRSKGELMIAKGMYVTSRSGWLSDRSICYLASGRPVVAQDTGISELYPVGEGLLAFDDLDGAAAALEEVSSDYARHSLAARALAEEHFDSSVVIGRLLGELGIP